MQASALVTELERPFTKKSKQTHTSTQYKTEAISVVSIEMAIFFLANMMSAILFLTIFFSICIEFGLYRPKANHLTR